MFLPRKSLSDITNLSINQNGNVFVGDDQKIVKSGSTMMVNEYITKLLKENNALIRALAERTTEAQNLGLMVTKLNQQNLQLAQAHSQMLMELNMGRDRAKAAQHELGCTSAVLKAINQELEELKKLNRQNKRIQNKELQQAENNFTDKSSQLQLSHKKKICLPNKKRPERSQSLGPMPLTNQPTTDTDRRKSLRQRLVNSKAGSSAPTGNLFEIEDVNYSFDKREELKDETCSPSPTFQLKVEHEDRFSSSLKRTVGRPTRRAAVMVNSYKEMPLRSKLRRPE